MVDRRSDREATKAAVTLQPGSFHGARPLATAAAAASHGETSLLLILGKDQSLLEDRTKVHLIRDRLRCSLQQTLPILDQLSEASL